MMFKFFLLLSTLKCILCIESNLLGCYNDIAPGKRVLIEHYRSKPDCIKECFSKYYRYSFIYNQGSCMCGNYLGEQIFNATCNECTSCDPNIRQNLTDTYATGNLVPGPPRNFQVSNITENHVTLTWQEPESFVEITSYRIRAIVIHTYSSYSPSSPEWMYSNNTVQTELITLLPATKYNITLSTISRDGDGATVFRIIDTEIDTPDSEPTRPEIKENRGTQIDVKLLPTPNNNGPVSSYKIIVVNEDLNQDFDDSALTSYHEANKNHLSYYIAAELNPKDIENIFTVGDGQTYGKYYNAPLDPNINYNIILAVVSKLNNVEKVRYSNGAGTGNGVSILNVGDDHMGGDSPAVIIGLSVAIGLLTFMLIAGIIGFIVLKSRIVNRRHRLSENQELTLQGPMIEVENNGYIHEEEPPPPNHYRNLKQKVKTIPSNQLKVEPTNLLGVGRYGRVNGALLQEGNNSTSVAAYTIQDKKMSQETRKMMLQELDILVKVGNHENVIRFIGMCETSHLIYVVLEHASMNLKDLLLGSRDALRGRFSNMPENEALGIAIQIARGMAHLDNCNIIHKQLCARSVMIAAGNIAKISSYGIAQYFSHNKIPDYTRWTPVEVFKNHPPNRKSDVWSFACLLWEICSLGGTPYGFVSNNNEIPNKILKGLRLPQLQYVDDELYQLMLDCWQLDFDERPTFMHLVDSLTNLNQNTLIPHLNFKLFSNFQYEQFYPDMELAVRPLF